jgi:hypothetical protein
MSPRIARVGDKRGHGAPLDGIGRPPRGRGVQTFFVLTV